MSTFIIKRYVLGTVMTEQYKCIEYISRAFVFNSINIAFSAKNIRQIYVLEYHAHWISDIELCLKCKLCKNHNLFYRCGIR